MILARKQSTTTYPMPFYMNLSSDHVTGATGKTVTVTIRKAGGSFAAAAGAVSEVANGWYELAGNATDRSTLGSFLLHAEASGCDPVDREFSIVSYDPYAVLDANIVSLNGAAISLASEVQADVAKWKTATAPAMTGDAFARLGAPVGASISADVAAVKADTGAVKTKTDFLPSVIAGGAGGVFIAGSNAATSITTALTANITGNLSGTVGKSAMSLAAADVTGNLPADVKSITAGVDLSDTMKTSVTTAASAATPTVTLAATQSLYAPAKAGNKMDLVDAPNGTAVTAIQNGLATATNQTTILNRLGSWTGTGINTVLGAFKALLSKVASAPSDIGGTFDPATDSTEAIKDNLAGAGPSAEVIAQAVLDAGAALESTAQAILTDTGTTLDGKLDTIDGIVDDLKTTLDNIHDTDLPAIKSDTAAILEDTGTTLDGKIDKLLEITQAE